MKLEKNSVCSKWMDLVELVTAQDIDAINKEGTPVIEEFIEAMDQYKKTAAKERSGIK